MRPGTIKEMTGKNGLKMWNGKPLIEDKRVKMNPAAKRRSGQMKSMKSKLVEGSQGRANAFAGIKK